MCTNPEDITELYIFMWERCIIMLQFLMISFIGTVLYTEVLKNQLTIILLTWQLGIIQPILIT